MRRSAIFLALLLIPIAAFGSSYQYIRLGHSEDAAPHTAAGIAMMGGGDDIDEAFRWLCEKGGRGDFLILRARGDDDYNSYVNGLCKPNSVATLIIPDRESAQDASVSNIIRHAEAIFIAGGDQARYVNFWQGTPVQNAINDQIGAGRPIGGTSAGLAILGQFGYGALGDKEDDKDLSSREVLADPFIPRVTLVRNFLKVSGLENVITDSHFAKRDRMGRTLGFLARLMQDEWSKEPRDIAIDERSAVLVEADGSARVVGSGRGAYFIRPARPPKICRAGTPLSFEEIAIYHAPADASFLLSTWQGKGGEAYSLSVETGAIRSSKSGNAVY